MHLWEFVELANAKKSAIIKGGQMTHINYSCEPSSWQHDPEQSMAIIDNVLDAALKFAWSGMPVPLLAVSSGRAEQGRGFAERVGEFIDLCPIVREPGAKPGLQRAMSSAIMFQRNTGISSAALIYDSRLKSLYPQASELMREAVLGGGVQLLNIVSFFSESPAAGGDPARLNTSGGVNGNADGTNASGAAAGILRLEHVGDSTVGRALSREDVVNVTNAGGSLLFENLECPAGRESEMAEALDLACKGDSVGMGHNDVF
jgi:hypothetical protein